jgi:hypothetical protein
MKRFLFKTILLILTIIAMHIGKSGFLNTAFAYQPPPCLKLVDSIFVGHVGWTEATQISNPDSLKVDTCNFLPADGGITNQKNWFTRKNIGILFNQCPFDSAKVSIDSLFHVTDIKEELLQTKNEFLEFENSFARIIFKKTGSPFHSFVVEFDQYLPVDSICKIISTYSNVQKCITLSQIFIYTGVDENDSNFNLADNIKFINYSNRLIIKLQNNFLCDNINFNIFDLNGNIRISETLSLKDNLIEVDISALPSGTYFILMNGKKAKFNIVR